MDVRTRWGLREKPFENTLERRFFCRSPVHEEALARLELLAEDGDMGLGLLTGEIGSGKTFTAAVFARSLDPRRFVSVFVPGADLGFEPLLDRVNCTLRREAPTGRLGSPYELRLAFREAMASRVVAYGLHLAIVIDDAQELSAGDLTKLRALTNEAAFPPGRGIAPAVEGARPRGGASLRGPGAGSVMSVVLVGQPELGERVRSLPAVDTRVGLSYHLGRLGWADVAPYLAHRLRAAGHPNGRVFTDGAVRLLAERSHGIPRAVNRLAKLAMYRAASGEGAAGRARRVTEADVGSVAGDLAREAA